MPIQLNFALSLDDYLAAQRLYAKSNWWLNLNHFFGRIVLPVLGVCIFVLAFLISGKGISWVIFLGMAGLGIFLALYPLYMRLRLKQCYLRTRTDNGSCTLELNEDVIRMQGSNAKSEVDWTAVKSTVENDKVILIYLAPAKFFVIPKRICDEQQLNEVRELCKRKLSEKEKVIV